MTRLECAIHLLWNFRFLNTCDKEDVGAFARAIMELGRSELREEIEKRNEKLAHMKWNLPIRMESTGALPRKWM